MNISFGLSKLRESRRVNYGECIIAVNDNNALFAAFRPNSFTCRTLIGQLLRANVSQTSTGTHTRARAIANANFNHYRITLPANNVDVNFYMSKYTSVAGPPQVDPLNINETKVSGNVTRDND